MNRPNVEDIARMQRRRKAECVFYGVMAAIGLILGVAAVFADMHFAAKFW